MGLGCEKLRPERLLPPGTVPARNGEDAAFGLVSLQDEAHVGFEAMIVSIMETAERHLAASTRAAAKPARHRL